MKNLQGFVWNDELIENKIREVMEILGINRMPSASETEIVMKNSSLSNKIAKTGGFPQWAAKLGLEVKSSETSTGQKYEKKLKDYLIEAGYEVEQMSTKHPYDLLVNGAIKIDVKAARRYYYSQDNYFYTFNLEKANATCDLYVCWCINNEDLTDKFLIIPSKELKTTQLSIGVVSRYDKYIDRWDLIDKFNEFYKQLA
jgi:hypothetical protein